MRKVGYQNLTTRVPIAWTAEVEPGGQGISLTGPDQFKFLYNRINDHPYDSLIDKETLLDFKNSVDSKVGKGTRISKDFKVGTKTVHVTLTEAGKNGIAAVGRVYDGKYSARFVAIGASDRTVDQLLDASEPIIKNTEFEDVSAIETKILRAPGEIISTKNAYIVVPYGWMATLSEDTKQPVLCTVTGDHTDLTLIWGKFQVRPHPPLDDAEKVSTWAKDNGWSLKTFTQDIAVWDNTLHLTQVQTNEKKHRVHLVGYVSNGKYTAPFYLESSKPRSVRELTDAAIRAVNNTRIVPTAPGDRDDVREPGETIDYMNVHVVVPEGWRGAFWPNPQSPYLFTGDQSDVDLYFAFGRYHPYLARPWVDQNEVAGMRKLHQDYEVTPYSKDIVVGNKKLHTVFFCLDKTLKRNRLDGFLYQGKACVNIMLSGPTSKKAEELVKDAVQIVKNTKFTPWIAPPRKRL